ncbi:AAA family ATPase [Spirosoma luteum]|uniref:AAA family ATPase n=1 Tax=Spirosoma luteum TaxID=431553 RepID=UPI0003804235|nr:AAA family ATPase [Spirosoma luteum]
MENNIPNTNNFLNWVDIKNFKSIKDLHLDCKRVNVFIGKPNVGKSNILEGLGLLGAGYDKGKLLKGLARYQDVKDLFWDFDTSKSIEVASNRKVVAVSRGFGLVAHNNNEIVGKITSYEVGGFEPDDFQVNLDERRKFGMLTGTAKAHRRINENGFASESIPDNPERKRLFEEKLKVVKKYDFANVTQFENLFQDFLLPPDGANLYAVVRRNKELWADFARLFTDQKLELVLFDSTQEFLLQKKIEHYVWQYPYFSIADTFRRFMFYITAIESNKNSVIIFEEPEVHSFPPYTQEMAYRMIYDEDNQYFISTHSPYMLHPFIEKMDYKDLNVFITYYKDYQTHVRALTEEELTDILDYSTNVFFNLNKFEPNA